MTKLFINVCENEIYLDEWEKENFAELNAIKVIFYNLYLITFL